MATSRLMICVDGIQAAAYTFRTDDSNASVKGKPEATNQMTKSAFIQTLLKLPVFPELFDCQKLNADWLAYFQDFSCGR
jgi:hypothetical protein